MSPSDCEFPRVLAVVPSSQRAQLPPNAAASGVFVNALAIQYQDRRAPNFLVGESEPCLAFVAGCAFAHQSFVLV